MMKRRVLRVRVRVRVRVVEFDECVVSFHLYFMFLNDVT